MTASVVPSSDFAFDDNTLPCDNGVPLDNGHGPNVANEEGETSGDTGESTDSDTPSSHDRLDFRSDLLYGRDDEVRMLQEAYDNSIRRARRRRKGNEDEQQPTVILVSGYSGTGKTSLVRGIGESVEKSGGQFLSGKFDQIHQDGGDDFDEIHQGGGAEPYSAIIEAFDEMCGGLLKSRSPEDIEKLKSEILGSLGSEAATLTDLLPNLERIVGKQPQTAAVRGVEAQNRFSFAFQQFARSTCTPENPVVLVLDDLQWADEPSLDLIQALTVTEGGNPSLLFVMCYRDNEVDLSHPLSFLLSDLRSAGVDIVEIKLENLKKENVNKMISDTTHMRPSATQPLTDIVYRKTQGNCFFVVQFLKSLCSEGLLRFSAEEDCWHWQEKAIAAKGISDNVVELMASQIEKLPGDAQNVLKAAACIGSQFDVATLRLIFDFTERRKSSPFFVDFKLGESELEDSGDDLRRIMDLAVEEGLVDVVSVHARYKFAHDRIQQAAYSLIPFKRQPATHYSIGERILRKTHENDLDKIIFVVVDQLNRGVNLISIRSKRVDVSRLNLHAAEKAVASAAFRTAAKYLRVGISLLGQDRWKDEFELCMKLHNAAAEAEYISGNFSRMEEMLAEVFTHAESLEERLPAHLIHVQSLKARMKFEETMDAGFSILAQLGVGFPKSPGKAAVVASLIKTKCMLRRKSCSKLALSPPMKRERSIAAMQIMDALMPVGYLCKPEFFPLLVTRAVQLSVRHGIHRKSAAAFALYGLILCGVMGEVREGNEFAELALALVERFKATEEIPQVSCVIYSFVKHWQQSVKESLEPLLFGYRTGMQVGEVEYGLACSFRYAFAAIQSGAPLAAVEAEVKTYAQQMKNHKQEFVRYNLLPFLQFAQNMLVRSECPTQLTGAAMNETEVLERCSEQGGSPAIACYIYLNKMKLAYFYGNTQLAADMARKSRNISTVAPGEFEVYNHAFFDALISCEMAQTTKTRKWQKLAKQRLKSLKKAGQFAEENCEQKIMLVEAELCALKKQKEKAAKAFENAIALAAKNGFISDEAMAHERAWLFFDRTGDQFKSSHHYLRAYNCYLEWGAEGKAEQLYQDRTKSGGRLVQNASMI